MKKAKNEIDKITEIRIEEVIDEENKENYQISKIQKQK